MTWIKLCFQAASSSRGNDSRMGGRFEDDDGLGRLQRVAQDEDLEQSSEAEDEMSEWFFDSNVTETSAFAYLGWQVTGWRLFYVFRCSWWESEMVIFPAILANSQNILFAPQIVVCSSWYRFSNNTRAREKKLWRKGWTL